MEGSDAAAPGARPALRRAMDEADDFHVALDGVHLALGGRPVFRGLSCGFPRGRISIVLGGSGAGKSTLLRLLGGLQRPDEGSVRVAGVDLARLGKRALFGARKRIGMLFQGGALLDSMTVFQNVSLPLREHTRLSERQISDEVARCLEAVNLAGSEALLPRQLSGGMVRRAGLARAIVTKPEIVLCDEPFSGLDPVNVRRIEALLLQLNRELGLTLVVTSHHIPSTLRMAHRIVFLTDGRAVSMPGEEVLRSPDPRVAEFFAAETGELAEEGRDEPAAAPGAGP